MIYYNQKRKEHSESSKVAASKLRRSAGGNPLKKARFAWEENEQQPQPNKTEMNFQKIQESEVNHVGTCTRNEITLNLWYDEKVLRLRVISFFEPCCCTVFFYFIRYSGDIL